jgi:lipopolysaccharide export system protein LptA
MRLPNPRLLRRLFATGAVFVVLIVSAFYLKGILNEKQIGGIPRIPSDLVERTSGFTFSKSEGGRTLFTVHAAQEEQQKESGRAELHDVNIVIYGRQSNRFDQIYGSEFQYDPKSGDVIAKGDVNIDLEGNSSGASNPDQTPPQEIKNPIHLKTSGLVFNRNTGIADTRQIIQFSLPEANGTAMGATYDSRNNLLTLQSAVRLATTQKRQMKIEAQSAVVTKSPEQAVLRSVRVDQQSQFVQADKVTVVLRPDNTIERALGQGHVHVGDVSGRGFDVTAPQGELRVLGKQQIQSGTLFGGVEFHGRGPSPLQGTAQRVRLDFGANNQVSAVHAEDSVQITQGSPEKTLQLLADGADLSIGAEKKLEQAQTSGAAKILVRQKDTETTITADRFRAAFNDQNRPNYIVGSTNVKTVTLTPGKLPQVTTSREIRAVFNDQNAIQEADQTGDFRYIQGQQTATSDRAHYLASDDRITMTGSPRVHDLNGLLTAETIQLNRKTGVVMAWRDVKTTYTNLKPQPDGGILGSSDPIHVIGTEMAANQKTGLARFTDARLWQAANIVEAPVMVFDREHRSIQAEASPQVKVKCTLVQTDKSGKIIPVDVTSDHLSYVDSDRKATFSGNVRIVSAETTMVANTAQVFLYPRSDSRSGGQLDRIVAQGDIEIDQPERKATGNQLLYTAADDKVVLTASQGKRPVIFDPQRGRITGDSLTFYRHDDKVAVDGKESSRTVTQTRIQDGDKK